MNKIGTNFLGQLSFCKWPYQSLCPTKNTPKKVCSQVGTNWKQVVNDLGIWLSTRPQDKLLTTTWKKKNQDIAELDGISASCENASTATFHLWTWKWRWNLSGFYEVCNWIKTSKTGNTKGGSITVPLTACLNGLNSSCFTNKIKNCQ